ncbi:MAG: 16S rRNA (adenine(1518)-N(6)/adenine(1519)-N(6))-dimethyltransferase RsmA [Methylophaga sp.]|nr:16S rRNA (adenine(1518)-N(6)/adenine(1519)-N(6))-dimethyltransferase RsmA [Methylophaga sp.]
MSRSNNPYPQARKRFGQNFLHDQTVIDGIVAAISPQPDQHLVEIGPGHGALTMPLLTSGAKLDVVELDRDLVPLLAAQFNGADNLTLHNADALQFDYMSLAVKGEKLRIIGNLPYNITTPLLFHLLAQSAVIDDMCFMLQKEVVERICAAPGSKQYGRLTIMLQYQCAAEALFDVPPEAFDPAPKVNSAIIYLQPRSEPLGGQVNRMQLNKLVTQAFSQRRKTIANTLKKLVNLEQLRAVGISPEQRPETVSIEQFVKLTRVVFA